MGTSSCWSVRGLYVMMVMMVISGTQCKINPYFWHITDLHFDPAYYGDDAINSCNDELDNRGMYGDYECDPPYELVEASVKALVDHGREPEFILFTGDVAAHMKNYTLAGWGTEVVISFIQNITDLFIQTFPNTKFMMALGNHDYYPKNNLPGENNDVYEAVANMWSPWLDPEAIATLRTGGYYTQLISPDNGLRVVVTNSHLYSTTNQATEGLNDPGGQYVWLNSVLGSARTNGEKVHLVAHTPLGVFPVSDMPRWLREADNANFTDIISEYSDVIMGVYSSHEHFDTFRLFYKQGKAGTAMFVAPSVSPWRARLSDGQRGMAHNPGVRKVFMDDIGGHLSDIEQFYLDLPKANTDKEANWLSLYSFRRVYVGVSNVTASSLHELVQTFKEYGNNDFHHYYDFNSVNARHTSNEPCSCLCKFTHICSMENVKYEDFEACYAQITCDATSPRVSVVFILSTVTLLMWFV